MSDHSNSTVYLLKRAELAVRGCVERALADVALTPSQYFILVLVRSGEATSSAELARATGVLPQSMTELIAQLEKRGAIARRPDAAHNRILRIELTPVGSRLFDKATAIARKLERELLEDFGPTDLTGLNDAFRSLIGKAEAHSLHPKLRARTKVAAKTARAVPRVRRSRRG